MALLPCQLDPYTWTAPTVVTACTPAEDGRYHVVVEESLFYPEGGGQPADHGVLGGVSVVDVQRHNGEVIHVTDGPVALGAATQSVDGARRFDHMQQHTAQHLITAIAEDTLGRATLSFHLGADRCTIELDGPVSAEGVVALENAVNEAICANAPVRPRVVTTTDYEALSVRSRGLPVGHSGDVRLVEIEGIDLNTCGGTHVARLGELQMVHLLGTERARGGGCRLGFLAGGRVLARLRDDTERSAALTRLLKCGASEHVAAVGRIQDSDRAGAKAVRALEQELAAYIGQSLSGPAAPVCVHRPTADLGVLRAIVAAANLAHTVLLTGDGVFVVAGPGAGDVGPRVAAALSGRGGGRGDRYQGKAADLSEAARHAAEACLTRGEAG